MWSCLFSDSKVQATEYVRALGFDGSRRRVSESHIDHSINDQLAVTNEECPRQ